MKGSRSAAKYFTKCVLRYFPIRLIKIMVIGKNSYTVG